MTQVSTEGVPTGAKPINTGQLQSELETAGVDCSAGLGTADERVFTYDEGGVPIDFPSDDQALVEQTIAAHVAMRDKTDAELAAEFRAAGTTPARKQDIRDMQSGLLEREQVPMEST